MAGIAASQLASATYSVLIPLLFEFLMNWHQQHLLQSWEVWFYLGSSRPCDTDLRVDEHKETICVLNGKAFGAGQIC